MSKDEPHDGDVSGKDDTDTRETRFLLCRLDGEIFGIDIQHVTDILELQKITEIPSMPDYVKGVINLRGRVIPVIDMRIRFGIKPKEYDDRTVITVVNIKDYSVGFIVDTTTEVQHISETDIDYTGRYALIVTPHPYIKVRFRRG